MSLDIRPMKAGLLLSEMSNNLFYIYQAKIQVNEPFTRQLHFIKIENVKSSV